MLLSVLLRLEHRFHGSSQKFPGKRNAAILSRDLRTLQQEDNGRTIHFRILAVRLFVKRDDTLSLILLVLFNQLAERVVAVRNLGDGIHKRTTAMRNVRQS